jgi:hypothetical protein
MERIVKQVENHLLEAAPIRLAKRADKKLPDIDSYIKYLLDSGLNDTMFSRYKTYYIKGGGPNCSYHKRRSFIETINILFHRFKDEYSLQEILCKTVSFMMSPSQIDRKRRWAYCPNISRLVIVPTAGLYTGRSDVFLHAIYARYANSSYVGFRDAVSWNDILEINTFNNQK